MSVTPPITPVIPKVPTKWTPQAIITFVGAVSLFAIGTLTQAGIVLPAHVTADVALFVGAAGQITALVTALITHIYPISVEKARAKARQ